jgi:stage V sporulation protein B
LAEENRQNFLHGAAILAAGVVVIKILGAIYKIPLRNIIGETGYGYFFAAYTIYNFFLTISTAGLPVALSRMISEANTLDRPRQARRTFRVAMVTLGALGLVFSLLMLLFPTEMAIAFVSKANVSQCVFAIAPSVFLVCLTSAFRGYIQGNGNMKPTTVGQVIEVLVKVIVGLALAIWFTRLGKSVPVSAAGAIFGVSVGSLAALLYMLASYLKQYRTGAAEACARSSDAPESVGRTLWSFIRIGVPITLGASVMSLFSLIDTKLINMQLPSVPGIGPALADELYGAYSTMTTLYNLPAAFITPMSIAVVPAISAAAVRRARGEVGSITESSLRISAVIAMPMGVGLAVLAAPIVRVMFPDSNAAGPVILTYLGIAGVFVCTALVSNAILQADGKERLPIVSMLAGGVVKIACNLLLVSRPEIHILGACIGTIACYGVICVLNCIFIARSLRQPPRYDRAFLRPLLSGAVMGAAAWAVYGITARVLHVGGGASRRPLLVCLAVAIVAAAAVYLVMVIVTRSVTLEDMKLIPKGEKIARLLHIR